MNPLPTAPEPALTRLLAEVDADFAATAGHTAHARPSAAVRAALASVPREAFVPEARRSQAWENRPLPIGHGQTISQPFIVALMTDVLDLQPGERVLEIGTGCGYQTAVLARLGARVVSVEVVPALARDAAARLARLGVGGVELHVGDGSAGWPDGAPYDAIIATAAPARLPAAWLRQLKAPGRLVAPVGAHGFAQSLQLLRRDARGHDEVHDLLPVAFVPLVGASGHDA